MSAKVNVLLQDPVNYRAELNEPLGLEVIAGSIRNEFSEDRVPITMASSELSAEEVDPSQFDLVGLSSKIGAYSPVKGFLAKPGQVTVIGNVLGTFAYQELLKDHPDLICVVGEGDEAIVGIVGAMLENGSPKDLQRTLAKRNVPNVAYVLGGKVVEPTRELVDLSKASKPVRHFTRQIVQGKGITRIEASRGCPWSMCNYCATSAKYGAPGWRPFPLDHVLDELRDLSRLGSVDPYFADEDFLGNEPDRAIEIADRIMAAKRDGIINPNMRLRNINLRAVSVLGYQQGGVEESRGRLLKLKEAGMYDVFLGIESGSDSQLSRYGKGANSSHNLSAIRLLQEMGICIDIGFIMFDPEVTLVELAQNIQFIYQAGLHDHPSRMTKALRVQVGTTFQEQFQDHLTGSLDLDSLSYPYQFADPLVQEVYEVFRVWEQKDEELIYRMQAQLRGEAAKEDTDVNLCKTVRGLRGLNIVYLSFLVQTAIIHPCAFQEMVRQELPNYESQRQILLNHSP